jgi:putative FmdB family regulatory protein
MLANVLTTHNNAIYFCPNLIITVFFRIFGTLGGFEMPIYEYECSHCGAIEEAIQKFSDAPLTTCKHCCGKLSRLISQSSFHLKGGGWYADGYGDKSANNNTTSKKEDCSLSSPAPEKATDSNTKSAGETQ